MKCKLLTNLLLLICLSAVNVTANAGDIYRNSIGMDFKALPAGSFYMGSCHLSVEYDELNQELQQIDGKQIGISCPSDAAVDELASDNETLQHQVIITKPFQMGVYEVTVSQFRKFIKEAGRDDIVTDDFIKGNSSNGNYRERAAVSAVSWYDVKDFIGWLNKREGTNQYRLPTEAEWEYAARAGGNTVYHWGDSDAAIDDYAWYRGNSFAVKGYYSHPVGVKKRNSWGLYDMHGNVWEWVEDWYYDRYYNYSTKYDPNGRGVGNYKVNRGGSWMSILSEGDLRAANRGFSYPLERSRSIGFRVVRGVR
ncbi:MAG: formylglycine-generating enzyme family protein [Thiotrichales bacterium]|mgnify:FL=1|jgi:formylglycine-generating enzyme required for sulfatase activity|nr:formylglycine-generating enzyme family protein [Thiotrichales bacterium]MBT3752621.1 formylglycine-generating enzyme family protein [Thiotrichales bacterium]MBT3837908.1 formylglycine-generating enzyme family protein [Thiotrichales bacterium]MBT4151696.1 formylglycine-generating enzyme family protein [Thiotrichales bacterium]MBT4261609.1 formylglycine-generating enzyme family protein [Thiotrichales bacterium]